VNAGQGAGRWAGYPAQAVGSGVAREARPAVPRVRVVGDSNGQEWWGVSGGGAVGAGGVHGFPAKRIMKATSAS